MFCAYIHPIPVLETWKYYWDILLRWYPDNMAFNTLIRFLNDLIVTTVIGEMQEDDNIATTKFLRASGQTTRKAVNSPKVKHYI